jgi:hypothetical protein
MQRAGPSLLTALTHAERSDRTGEEEHQVADREAPGRTAQDGPAEDDRPPGPDTSAVAGGPTAAGEAPC